MEDFVTYEQAVKLKELGFDWECAHVYYGENATHIFPDERKKLCDCFKRNSNSTDYRFSAPSLAQVQKWLREVKRIVIAIIPKYEIQCDGTYQWQYWYKIYNSVGNPLDSEPCGTYEYALEMAIDKVLELLKEENDDTEIQKETSSD